jgi:hypothetical protein
MAMIGPHCGARGRIAHRWPLEGRVCNPCCCAPRLIRHCLAPAAVQIRRPPSPIFFLAVPRRSGGPAAGCWGVGGGAPRQRTVVGRHSAARKLTASPYDGFPLLYDRAQKSRMQIRRRMAPVDSFHRGRWVGVAGSNAYPWGARGRVASVPRSQARQTKRPQRLGERTLGQLADVRCPPDADIIPGRCHLFPKFPTVLGLCSLCQ